MSLEIEKDFDGRNAFEPAAAGTPPCLLPWQVETGAAYTTQASRPEAVAKGVARTCPAGEQVNSIHSGAGKNCNRKPEV